MNPQHPTHGPDVELGLMRPDEGVLHWDSRAKYAFAMALEPVAIHDSPFFRMSRSSVTRASSRFSRRFSASWSMPLAFGEGSANSLSHLYSECELTPRRRETSRTGYPSALAKIFAFIANDNFETAIAFADYYDPKACSAPGVPVRIWDPVNNKNNVSALYTVQNKDRIVEAALDAGDAIDSALRAITKGETVRYWQKIFGPTFNV
jgi:hypothetical protein